MPERPFTRDQLFLVPPSVAEWVPDDHPVRFVDAFMAELTPSTRVALGLDEAAAVGAPRYAPEMLARVWVYGFTTGVRSARALERACRDELPYRWLSGNQTPDHATLWRWYAAHREGMRALLAESVRVAVHAGLVDLAVMAVDGTKLRANAAADRMLTAAELTELETQTQAAIAELEARHQGDDGPSPPRLPPGLRSATALRERIVAAQAACAERAAATGRAASVRAPRANVTDPDARWMKTRQGTVPGYNAQVAVVATTPRAQVLLGPRAAAGRFVVAAAVTTQPTDTAQLAPLVEEARAHLGVVPVTTVADAGYFAGEHLAAVAALGTQAVVAEADATAPRKPYHRTAFRHDPVTDTLHCPAEHVLRPLGRGTTAGGVATQRYGGIAATCRACPAFGTCTRSAREGRVVTLTAHDAAIQAQRRTRAFAAHQLVRRRRKELVEGVIGTLKTTFGGSQVRTRGRAKVDAEWHARCVGANVRTLTRLWSAVGPERQWQVLPLVA